MRSDRCRGAGASASFFLGPSPRAATGLLPAALTAEASAGSASDWRRSKQAVSALQGRIARKSLLRITSRISLFRRMFSCLSIS